MELLRIIIYLAKKGALSRPVGVTTSNIGNELGLSQQSVSRWLLSLEKKGYMERSHGIRGYMVQLTNEGRKYMIELRRGLDEALSECGKMIIKGRVVSGMGEGQYYIGLEGYTKGIKEMMGFLPFPGTLNLKLKTLREYQFKEKLSACKGIMIPSFSDDERTFGSLKCFHASIKEKVCAIIIPERSHYGNDMLEIVAPVNLRNALGLADGDDVSVEVNVDENI